MNTQLFQGGRLHSKDFCIGRWKLGGEKLPLQSAQYFMRNMSAKSQHKTRWLITGKRPYPAGQSHTQAHAHKYSLHQAGLFGRGQQEKKGNKLCYITQS